MGKGEEGIYEMRKSIPTSSPEKSLLFVSLKGKGGEGRG